MMSLSLAYAWLVCGSTVRPPWAPGTSAFLSFPTKLNQKAIPPKPRYFFQTPKFSLMLGPKALRVFPLCSFLCDKSGVWGLSYFEE